MPPGLGEFDIIARYFAPLAAGAPGALGLLDDGALVDLRPGESLVVTTDAVVAGVHFPVDAGAEQVAAKILGVNLSDLAAMGAEPRAYLLALALPDTWRPAEIERWLAGFTTRLAEDQAKYGLALIGGDTVATPGPLTLSMTALGVVEDGRALRRAGAAVGDAVYVSGTLGDAALGLRVAVGELRELRADDRALLLDRFHAPQPRVALGRRLIGIATAVADVSDGLLADLGRICTASSVDATIDAARVPVSPAAAAAIAADPGRLALALSGGDDYELVFTAARVARPALVDIAREIGLPLTEIGRITERVGDRASVRAFRDGLPVAVESAGWQHFS
ncbi:MAG: thiamine-phosphate kinase [Rhodospirillales bacterium]|nr:thiamine-phosphate kinase [Rhodospirillales bacterium]